MTGYDGWWSVPDHLLTKTALGELEFPRTATGSEPAGAVYVEDGPRGGKDSHYLYDARTCLPTSSSAAHLVAAVTRAGSHRTRTCADCGAHCQRPLAAMGEGEQARAVCPACRHVALLRQRQEALSAGRAVIATDLCAVLDGDPAVALQVDLHVPPPTDSGRARPATAARIRIAGLDCRRLLDVTLRLVGPRASWVPEGAVDPDVGRPRLRRVLDGRRLIVWSGAELDQLRTLVDPGAGHPSVTETAAWFPALARSWPTSFDSPAARAASTAVVLGELATHWRGQLDPRTRTLVACLAPGSPDRLALLLRRMAGRPDTDVGT